MNVNLTPQLEELVRAKGVSGLYTSASEVVREALRLMDEQDRLREAKLQTLRDDVRQGLDSGQSQPWIPQDIKSEGRARRSPRPTFSTLSACFTAGATWTGGASADAARFAFRAEATKIDT